MVTAVVLRCTWYILPRGVAVGQERSSLGLIQGVCLCVPVSGRLCVCVCVVCTCVSVYAMVCA